MLSKTWESKNRSHIAQSPLAPHSILGTNAGHCEICGVCKKDKRQEGQDKKNAKRIILYPLSCSRNKSPTPPAHLTISFSPFDFGFKCWCLRKSATQKKRERLRAKDKTKIRSSFSCQNICYAFERKCISSGTASTSIINSPTSRSPISILGPNVRVCAIMGRAKKAGKEYRREGQEKKRSELPLS